MGFRPIRATTHKITAELEELVETAELLRWVRSSRRESIHPASYVGPGKLEELRELLYTLDATGIVCDDELSPAQYGLWKVNCNVRFWTERL